jgi:prepilin-type processing-associated H-X9-DG protein
VDDYFGPGRPFGGCHRGGGQALYADGSARFLAATVDPAIVRAEARLARDLLPPAGP